MLALWIKQEGEGCDYMIGCGSILIELDTDDMIEAELKARYPRRLTKELNK